MDTIDLLIFDLDGTLIDSRTDIAFAVNLTLQEINLPPKPEEEILQAMGCGVRWLLEQAAAPHPLPPLHEILPIFGRHYRNHLLDQTTLYPDVRETLAFFRNKRMAVATNKPIEHTTRILDGLGISGYFQMVMGGDSTLNPKPHPEMILKTLEILRTDGDRALMIGDGVNDILAARAAGVPCCAVIREAADPAALLQEKPDFVCRSFREIQAIRTDRLLSP